jgi:HEAT repeat protein
MFAAPSLPRTLSACLRDLGDASPTVRASAVRDLGRHTTGEDRAAAIAALEGALADAEARVRAAAATSLADAEATEAREALERAADDGDALVRQMAVAALGEIGDARALPRLERALVDPRGEVRFQAVIAYPRLAEGSAALDAIEAATRDADPLVAHIALRMGEELGEKAGEVDARIVRRARALLGHDAPLVRIAAAVLLARAGETGGEELLVAAATGDLPTPEGADEAAAIELCGELGLDAARKGLEKRAFGGLIGFFRDRFQWHAKVALARMGHERARREIEGDLDAWDPQRRTLAVAAVGRARLTGARDKLRAMQRDGRANANALEEALRALEET